MNYSNEFRKLINNLLESPSIKDANKVNIQNEAHTIMERHLESHVYVAYMVLKKLKENDVYFEVEGPLLKSFILFNLELVKDNPIISLMSFAKKIYLTIKLKTGDDYKRKYQLIVDALKDIGQTTYVYKEILKRYSEIYIPYLYYLVAIFDENIYKECIELNDVFRIKRIALKKERAEELGLGGMIIKMKGKV